MPARRSKTALRCADKRSNVLHEGDLPGLLRLYVPNADNDLQGPNADAERKAFIAADLLHSRQDLLVDPVLPAELRMIAEEPDVV